MYSKTVKAEERGDMSQSSEYPGSEGESQRVVPVSLFYFCAQIPAEALRGGVTYFST